MDAQGLGVVAGAEEQGDLHDALVDQVHQAADAADGAEQGDAEHDVGHLAHRRVGQAPLEVVLEQRAQAAPDDGDRRSERQRGEQAERLAELDAIHLVDDAGDAEGAGLDHRHRVQQRRDGRGGDHGQGQPAVQRHQRGLDAETDDQQQEDDPQLAAMLGLQGRRDAAVGELGMPQQMVQPDDAGQQQRAADQRVGQVDGARPQRLGVAAMDHQGKGGQGQQLVEDEEGEQVGGHGDAHGGGDADAEEAEEAAAVRLALQVADGVQGGEQPENRRQGDEQHAQGIGIQGQIEAGQHGEAHLVGLAGMHAGDQDADQHQLGDRGKQVERRTQAVAGFRQDEDEQAGQQRRGQHRQRQQLMAGHTVRPMDSSAISSTPRSPSSTLAAASTKAISSRVRGTATSSPARGARRKAWRSTRNT
ncbi:hypothetical protein D3C78_868420 [compost metagenome]